MQSLDIWNHRWTQINTDTPPALSRTLPDILVRVGELIGPLWGLGQGVLYLDAKCCNQAMAEAVNYITEDDA
ncbi:hypothetical protein [Scytonema sp. PRP1]|uniref:hypothetical protein n=1 Tax=Scytonema sp. PRP1 TaxID=3120513 RepID=UPI002FD5EAE4